MRTLASSCADTGPFGSAFSLYRSFFFFFLFFLKKRFPPFQHTHKKLANKGHTAVLPRPNRPWLT